MQSLRLFVLLGRWRVTTVMCAAMCQMSRRLDPAAAMRHLTDPERRYSTRTLAFLTAAYVVAAGCNGVLAVMYRARWHGVLAVVLAVAASGFLVYTVQNAQADRAASRPLVPPMRRDAPPSAREPAPNHTNREKTDRAAL